MSRHGLGRQYVKSLSPSSGTNGIGGWNWDYYPDSGKFGASSGWLAGRRNWGSDNAVGYLDELLQDNPLWNTLSNSQKLAVVNQSWSSEPDFNILGNKYYSFNLNDIVNDFTNAQKVLDSYEYDQLVAPDYDKIDEDLLTNYYQPIYDRIAQEQADMKDFYTSQLKDSADAYNYNANAILGNQTRQNAMIQDSLRSDLARTRQNALEAGASAGLRIAGNVNATLAAQNKAAQTSMETSNNLAQLLLNQRQAAAGIRSDYRNYMSESNRYRDSQQSDYLNRRASERELARNSWQDRIDTAEDRLSTGNLGTAYDYASGELRNKIYGNGNTKANN